MTTSSYESLSHSKWDCKYHVVFIPKGRKKTLYGKIRGFLGPVLGIVNLTKKLGETVKIVDTISDQLTKASGGSCVNDDP